MLLGLLAMSSCGTVKSYEKSYVSDADMELKGHYCERFETSFQIYREAASGANGGKSGGGCGCN